MSRPMKPISVTSRNLKRPALKTTGRRFSTSEKGTGNKRAIISLVERGGEVRSFHVPGAYLENVVSIVRANIARETRLHTDESRLYRKSAKSLRRMRRSITAQKNTRGMT